MQILLSLLFAPLPGPAIHGATNRTRIPVSLGGTASASTNPAIHQGPIINCGIRVGVKETFSALCLRDGHGTGKIQLDGGVIVCGLCYGADACAMDTKEGRLVVAGGVTSDLLTDVSAGCVFAYGGEAELSIYLEQSRCQVSFMTNTFAALLTLQ